MPDIDHNRASVASTGFLSGEALSYDRDFIKLEFDAANIPEDEISVEVHTSVASGTKLFLYDDEGRAISQEELQATALQPIAPIWGKLISGKVYAEIGRLNTAASSPVPGSPALPPAGAATITVEARFHNPQAPLNAGQPAAPTILSKAITLIPVEIEEVISDQIAGNEANKLPTAFFGGNPVKPENGHSNNPMLMAARSGSDARLMIKMNVPVEYAASIWVGVRQTRQTTILNSVPSVPPPGKTELPFPAVAGSQLYEVVAGYVANSHLSGATLDKSNVSVVFQRTPKKDKEDYPATVNLHLLDKIIVVIQDDFNAARETTVNHSGGMLATAYGAARGLLEAFATGDTTVAGVVGVIPTSGHVLNGSPIPSKQGLAHAVGGKWTSPANNTTTFRFEFPANSDLAGDVDESAGIVAMIGRLLADNKATLAAAATTTESIVPLSSLTDYGINFAKSDQ
jgi:hypothetical protein